MSRPQLDTNAGKKIAYLEGRLMGTCEEGREEKQAGERPNAGVKTDFCSELSFYLCRGKLKLPA